MSWGLTIDRTRGRPAGGAHCTRKQPGCSTHSQFLSPPNPTPSPLDLNQLAVAVNDTPTVQAEAYTTQEDTPLTKDAASGVLSGAGNPDNEPLTALVSRAPDHGSLSLGADGSFTYTPAPDFNGADGFEFLVSDTKGGTAKGKASITVGES
jgi:hypothetical protein